jgi:16S rRNA (guanine527-N7)-methyltransferase
MQSNTSSISEHSRQLLEAGLDKLKLKLDQQQINQMLDFIGLIAKWNRTHNLTAITDIDEMINKHLLDSLSVAEFLPSGGILDVGSGAGLPGVPLAIVSTNNNFTLVDSSQKRIGFLKEVKRKLALTNISPVHSRVEQLDSSGFDIIMSRAYSSLDNMLSQTQHLLVENGRWLAMKGAYPESEISEVSDHYKITKSTKLTVPGLDAERYLIEIVRA